MEEEEDRACCQGDSGPEEVGGGHQVWGTPHLFVAWPSPFPEASFTTVLLLGLAW